MASRWYGSSPGSQIAAAWAAQDGLPWSTEANSAPLGIIRDRLAEGLEAQLTGNALRKAFGHLLGAIGTPPPFAVVLPGPGPIVVTQTGISEPLPGQVNATGVLQEWDIPLDVGLCAAVNGPDTLRIADQLEPWIAALAEFFSENRSVGQTVLGCSPPSFTQEIWKWAEIEYVTLFAHVTVRAQYRLRAH